MHKKHWEKSRRRCRRC